MIRRAMSGDGTNVTLGKAEAVAAAADGVVSFELPFSPQQNDKWLWLFREAPAHDVPWPPGLKEPWVTGKGNLRVTGLPINEMQEYVEALKARVEGTNAAYERIFAAPQRGEGAATPEEQQEQLIADAQRLLDELL
jgi:hypothetical protein